MRVSRFKIYSLSVLSFSCLAALTSVAPVWAQGSVQKNATEKSTWHTAPREIQIIDDRPIIRDFREAPVIPQQIQLPPGPVGYGGSGGGNGGGALAGGPGSTIPAGGMPLSGNQGYRTPSEPMGALPKSGFGRGSNIPAGGMAPKGMLPSGFSTNGLNGKMLNQNKASGAGAGAPRGMAPSAGRTNGDYKGPAAATYSGGYGNGSGAGYGGSASRTESMVRGSLLRK
ncbi:hypothetical protein BH10CYA1_BH10CYA1_33790 [soil metagenome]